MSIGYPAICVYIETINSGGQTMQCKVTTSLEKIFDDAGSPVFPVIERDVAAKGEVYSFQIVLTGEPGWYGLCSTERSTPGYGRSIRFRSALPRTMRNRIFCGRRRGSTRIS